MGRASLVSAERIDAALRDVRAWSGAHYPHMLGVGDRQLWHEPGVGVAAYRRELGTLCVAGEPIARDERAYVRVLDELERLAGVGRMPVYYLVGPRFVERVRPRGYGRFMLGHEAIVPLAGDGAFSLDGPHRAYLRRVLRRFDRLGVTFTIAQPPHTTELLAQVREVSDAWLAGKGGRERQFSLGHFSVAYLQRCPLAIAMRDGRVAAFANLLCASVDQPASEAGIDLIRYEPHSSWGLMHALLTHAMLWAQERGHKRFSLSMAPLAGVGRGPDATVLERLAGARFVKGDDYFNYRGLLEFKQVFAPRWEPRFMAYPSAAGLPMALWATTRLVMARSARDVARIAAAREWTK
jgi:phosphatidylglycerol lysyltransferase